MHWKRFSPQRLVAIGAMALLAALAVPAPSAQAYTYSGGVMWTPPSGAPSYGSLYAHAIELQHSSDANGELLASFEQYSSSCMPIYRSLDSGKTWTQISSVCDTVNSWHNIQLEPVLYELPQAIGAYPAGTILAALFAGAITSSHWSAQQGVQFRDAVTIAGITLTVVAAALVGWGIARARRVETDAQ